MNPSLLVDGAAAFGRRTELWSAQELRQYTDQRTVHTRDAKDSRRCYSSRRLRLDAAFRVVAPVGGWQTGTLSEVSSEGLYRVKLAGGVERWATAEQIIAVHSAADGADLADGILAAVLPSADVELAAARWLPAAVVRGAADRRRGRSSSLGLEASVEVPATVVGAPSPGALLRFPSPARHGVEGGVRPVQGGP